MTLRRFAASLPLRALLVTTILFALPAAAINTGALDVLSMVGRVNRSLATSSLILYWILTCGIVLGWRSWRRAPGKTALATASAVLGLGAFEILARVTGLPMGQLQFKAVESPRFHHAYPPNAVMSMRLGDGGWTAVRTNEDGFRTGYSRAEFLGHQRRIAVLGDSFAFGLGVREAEAFPSQLEKLLRDGGAADTAVLNTAVISYSPFLETLVLEGVAAGYRPDTVVLLLDATDIADDYRYMTAARTVHGATVFPIDGPTEMSYYGPTIEILRTYLGPQLSYPLRVITRRATGFNYEEFRIPLGDQVSTNTYFHFQHPLDVTRPYFEATLRNISATAAAARAIGAEFVLLVAPRFQHWNPRECPTYDCPYDRAEQYQLEMFRFFAEARSRVDYRILDLLPYFREAGGEPLAFAYDPHWNARGHAFVARVVADYLRREDLVR